MQASKNIALTISRQIGSGGAYVGQQVAKRLQVFYADREIVRAAARQLSVREDLVAEHEESVPNFWRSFLRSPCIYPDLYMPPPLMLMPADNDFFLTESEVIQRIADQRPAVIMGRCGFDVLRNHPGRISVFLHADRDFRVARYQSIYKTTAEEAEKTVDRFDKERSHYCRNYTGCDHADARNYDLSIDTSRLNALDQAVELILRYIALRH